MKTTFTQVLFSILLASGALVNAQGTFQNLNFEQANPISVIGSPYYPYAVTAASALPGWSASIGGVPVTQVLHNNMTLGEASIDIFGPNWDSGILPGNYPCILEGNYTVFLQAFDTAQGNVSIWQNGTVPANAESLQFSAWSYLGGSASFSVSFAASTLTPVVIGSGQAGSGQDYNIYGANIAPYAGQTGQLEFTSLAGGSDWNEFDDISFSPNAIPEPSPFALMGIGGLVFALYRRVVPKHQ